jgi:hypothetical protein
MLDSDVRCDVVVDKATIEGITFNRGKCSAGEGSKFPMELEFGESFRSKPGGTCNLLEYAITVNGQTWTWKVK